MAIGYLSQFGADHCPTQIEGFSRTGVLVPFTLRHCSPSRALFNPFIVTSMQGGQLHFFAIFQELAYRPFFCVPVPAPFFYCP